MSERLQDIKTRTYDFTRDDDREQLKDDMTWLIEELEKERSRLTKYLDLNEQEALTSFPRFVY